MKIEYKNTIEILIKQKNQLTLLINCDNNSYLKNKPIINKYKY